MISPLQKIEISDFITSCFGTMISVGQWFELETKIKHVCLELQLSDWENFALSIPELSPKSKEMEMLACQLSVGETYFFREVQALDLFKYKILPSLIKQQSSTKSITIWSAGCCSGEEPYTLAMIIKETIPNSEDWDITINASDINTNFLQKAIKGIYTPWSFRNTPDWAMKKYFKKSGKQFEIDASIRKMVRFSRVNLIDETAFPSYEIKPWSVDVIFCRNVFIYFPTAHIKNIAQRFKSCLTESGWLVTSPVEVSNDGLKCLKYEWYPGVGILRKDSRYKTPENHEKPSMVLDCNNKIDDTKTIHQDDTPSSYGKAKSHQDIQQPNITQLLTNARQTFDVGQYCIAAGHVKSILKQNQNHTEALVIQAKIFANLGDLDGALDILKNLTKSNSNNAHLHYLLATMYAESHKSELAEKSLRQALYLEPNMISAQFLMGSIMQGQGNSKAAYKHFANLKELLNKHPKEDVLPELDGMTAGALSKIINCLVG